MILIMMLVVNKLLKVFIEESSGFSLDPTFIAKKVRLKQIKI